MNDRRLAVVRDADLSKFGRGDIGVQSEGRSRCAVRLFGPGA